VTVYECESCGRVKAQEGTTSDQSRSYAPEDSTAREILESYPDARGRAIRIDVVCKFEPDKMAEEFLLRARTIVRDAGLALTWRVPNSAMHATCEDARA
jgi:hypothetical protein